MKFDWNKTDVIHWKLLMACLTLLLSARAAQAAVPPNMALIPAGNFTMGDSLDGDSGALPVHEVYVSEFYMDRYEVTKALWDDVYNWGITHGYSFDNAGLGKAANHPVHTISWYDMVKWCNARSEKEGRIPAYYTSAVQTAVYRNGQVALDNSWVKWNRGYRLPTEAEWEKASRGGENGRRFPWGDTISHAHANYYGSSASSGGYAYDLAPLGFHPTFNTGVYPYTSPVGYFTPNGYGLYDMAGNVWEWCWDWYGTYSSSSQTNPRGPTSTSSRLHRGGGWGNDSSYCRVAPRYGHGPAHRDYLIGFRSVLCYGDCLPIVFLQHPQSATNVPGGSVTLSVNVEGTPPFHYQWLYQGIFPVGGDSNRVTITNLSFTNLGSYYVDVTNCWGLRVRSFPAFVSMSTTNFPPNINYQPPDATVREGETARFDVGLYGNEPLGIWWKHNGALIPGAASASLVLSNVALSAAGNYQLFATNAYGSTNSRLATLTVQTNARPIVAITSPEGDSTFQAPTNLQIQVTASDPDGTLLGVEFFADGQRIAVMSGAPYDFSFFANAPGTHVFTAVATDNYGAQSAVSATFAFVMPPLVSAQPASSITASSATLNGIAVPNGIPATVYFRYGTNTSYGNLAAAGVLATSNTFSSPITGLRPGTTYYFEAVASNAVAVAFGGSRSFVTSPNAEANLAGLTLSAGSFTPAFAPAIISYNAGLSAAISNLTVTPTSTDANATIRVRVNGGSFIVVGSGSPSSLLTINPGINVIEVQVTAQDGGTVRTYSLTIGSGYTFTTLAGSESRTGINDGTGSVARFDTPNGLAVDSVGNIYLADSGNHIIRKVTPEGVVTTLAGLAGQTGSANGTGSVARFNTPNWLAADNAGNLYVTDWVNNTVRKVTPDGVVTTLAGTAWQVGSADGTGGAARFAGPNGVAVDNAGNVLVADRYNQTIRRITPGGVVTTLAGLVGSTGTNDGAGTAARFNNPNGAAVDSAGNFYVSDEGSHTIRKVTPAGVVTTVAGSAGNLGSVDGAGSAARFSHPKGLAVDTAGNLFLADWDNSILRKITPDGTVITVAGLAGNPFSLDGTGSEARFDRATAIAVDSVGNLYVAEPNSHTLRKGWPSVGGVSPTILSQPQDQTVAAGCPASFSVVAVGTGMLTYQWRRGGVNSSGATNSTYRIASAHTNDSAVYTVVVGNALGSVTSSNATLTTVPGPAANLVWINPGSSTMGSPGTELDRVADEGPQHLVTLTRSFWIGKYEVTQTEFTSVYGSNPGATDGNPQLPARGVTWLECVRYCDLLTEAERAAGRLPAGFTYRLPTEAEWEYACRAGTSTRFSHGDDPAYSQLGAYAWLDDNTVAPHFPQPVGLKQPNPWGLHDVHGNVSEYCLDWLGSYAAGAQFDPSGVGIGIYRVVRGGNSFGSAASCRSAGYRGGVPPDGRNYGVGFRPVLAALPSYSTGFENGVGPEWSRTNISVTPIGGRRFLGDFSNEVVRLFLTNLPPHTSARVSFDLFILRSWDGNSDTCCGPDVWSLREEGGPTLLQTTFSNTGDSANRQAYPGSFTRSSVPAQTGAMEVNTLGYQYPLTGGVMRDTVYHISIPFKHTNSSLALLFAAARLQGLTNESWGLDNVSIQLGDEDVPVPSNVFLVEPGEIWKYLDNGSNQGTNWIAASFNDAAWASGAAELGYGDNNATDQRPEVTVVSFGPNASARYITTYFRRAFVVSNAWTITNLTLGLLRDDGGIVYLNGVEVFRSNLPNGPVNFNTLATNATDDGKVFFTTTVSPTLLAEGTNVLAVEIHQQSAASTDLSFDLYLNADLTMLPPPTFTQQPQAQTVLQGGAVTFSVAVSGTPPFGYRWLKGPNTLVPFGLGGPTLTLTNVQPADATNYSCVVTNFASRNPGVASSSAILTVIAVPAVTPAVIGVQAGGSVNLSLPVPIGVRVVVEASTDLLSWEVLSDTITSNSILSVNDAAAALAGSRFYRIKYFLP